MTIHSLMRTTALAALLATGASLAFAQGSVGGSTSGSQSGTQAGAGQSTTGQSGGQMGQGPGSATGSPADGTKTQTPGQAAGSTPSTMGDTTMGGVMTDEQVRAQLGGQGYTDIQSVMRDGNDYRVRAMQNGRPMDLRVDAYTGTVRSGTAARR